jgi:anti-anti-sigma regulatory factor
MAVVRESKPQLRRPRVTNWRAESAPASDAPREHAVPDPRVVVTVNCDRTRASVRAAGALSADTVAALATAANTHIVAGRRYLRLDVSNVTSVDDAAIAVLAGIHARLLADRGTLILTGVEVWLDSVLAETDVAFLTLAPTAADHP